MLLQIKVITGVFSTEVAGLVAVALLATSSSASADRPGLRCTGAAEPLNLRAYSMGPLVVIGVRDDGTKELLPARTATARAPSRGRR
jgi:hypothetical protein